MAVLSRPPFVRPSFTALPQETTVDDAEDEISSLYDLVRFNAQVNPNHNFCIQAQQVHDQSDRTFDAVYITYKQLEDAVHRCANWLSDAISSSQDNSLITRTPVGLYLESDVGLFIHLVAVQALDIPVLLISARMSASNVEHLLEETSAKVLFTSKRTASLLSGQVDGRFDIKMTEPYTTFLSTPSGSQEVGLWPRDVNGARAKRIALDGSVKSLILHSSGTTGFPKPIPLTKRYLLQYASCHGFSTDERVDWINLTTLPMYHGFGLLAPSLSLSVGMTCVFPPSSIIPAGESTLNLLDTFNARSLMTVPSIVDDLLAVEGALDKLAELNFLAVGGGAMKPSQGLQLEARNVKLLNHYGVTEIGAIAHIFRPKEDYNWRYLRLRTDLNLQLRPIEGSPRFKLVGFPLGWDGPFEVQDELERNGDSSPENTEIRILGRVDDVIVLKTGEKVMPQHLETILNADPLIKTAVCVGQGSFELAVLVQPSETYNSNIPGAQNEFLDHVWKSISAANPGLDRHAQVSSRSAIIIKPPGKEFPRTDKGSISRRLVHEVFSQEIEAAYATLESEVSTNGSDTPKLCLDDLSGSIMRMAQSIFPAFVGDESDDFFEHGMDSLQAARLSRLLTSEMRRQSTNDMNVEVKLSPALIYQNPTVQRLATYVMAQRLHHSGDGSMVTSPEPQDRLSQMETFAQRFAASVVNDTNIRRDTTQKQSEVVLLTGATGNLGAHVLSLLTSMPSVTKVICLHRGARSSQGPADSSMTSSERFMSAVSSNGIQLDSASLAKVELVDYADFLRDDQHRHDAQATSNPREFPQSPFLQIAQQVTQILHLAWPMDFHRTLESFTPHLQIVEALVRLARLARVTRTPGTSRPVRLVFSSSIAVVRNYRDNGATAAQSKAVPEDLINDASASAPIGYPEAKWVCERMLAQVSRSCSDEVEPVVIRIGQISGPEGHGGQWKAGEHIPTLVKASKAIGAFPELKGTMSWIPVDRAAKCLTEILLHPGKVDCFLHLENPVRQPASDLVAIMSSELGMLANRPLLFEEWLEKAREVANIGSLADFFADHFRHLALGEIVLDTKKARTFSPTLQASCGLDKDLIGQYIRRWSDQGLFA